MMLRWERAGTELERRGTEGRCSSPARLGRRGERGRGRRRQWPWPSGH
jgi:hypothetical protein